MAQGPVTGAGAAARISRIYSRFYGAVAAIVAAAILFITVGISIDVVMRNTGLGVVPWMLEATEYCLFVATFIGAPWVLHLGEHVRIDMVVNNLPRRAARTAEIAADAAGLLVSAVLFYYGTGVAIGSRADGALVIKELVFPEWWIFAIVAFSALLLCVEFIIRLRNAVTDARHPPTPEIGLGGF